jgi:DnaJ homolog subfamily C member 19
MLPALIVALLAAFGLIVLIHKSTANKRPRVQAVSWLLAAGLIAGIIGVVLSIRGGWLAGVPLVAGAAAALWRYNQLKALIGKVKPHVLKAPKVQMDVEEALAVLGLQQGASPEEVRAAHRHLMQQMHPDQGGSDYLASKINQARDILLKNSD